jgi:hypothetical protein
MSTHDLSFPFYLGRIKICGKVDVRVLVDDEDKFIKVYRDFDADLMTSAIVLYVSDDKAVSV